LVTIPTYDQFIEPVIRFLQKHPEGVVARDVQEAAADSLNLNDAERSEMLPSGNQLVYKNRTGWAHDRLKRAGYSSSLRRGYWQLTDAGIALADQYPNGLPNEVVAHIATDFMNVRLKSEDGTNDKSEDPIKQSVTESPDDRLESAVSEIRSTVSVELLTILSQVSPNHFEAIVLDVLHQMGYGTDRTDLQRVGQSGDGGIDGIISLDKLGLEKVYVQAKRWQANVGRPELQAFYGALAGMRAKKGVFITTSGYTAQALEFVKTVEGIRLGRWSKTRQFDDGF
jgi:restriction system protein